MAANRKKGMSLLAGLDNLVEKPVEEGSSEEKKEEPIVAEKVEEIEEVKELNEVQPIVQKEIVYVPQYVNKPTPKRPPGRPRKYKEDDKTEVIGVKLLEEEVRFLEEFGWKYGGKTGYVTHLIRQEMEKKR